MNNRQIWVIKTIIMKQNEIEDNKSIMQTGQ